MIQYGQYHIEISIFALQVENIVFDKRIIQKSCFWGIFSQSIFGLFEFFGFVLIYKKKLLSVFEAIFVFLFILCSILELHSVLIDVFCFSSFEQGKPRAVDVTGSQGAS